MLPGRQSRALRQGLDRHAIVGLARALQRRHELARDRAGNLKPGFAVEDADRAHLMLGDMASAAEQRQEPARVGVVVAPDVHPEPDRVLKSCPRPAVADVRSEEHTSELQSLMRTSYAVFCLQKK